MKIKRTAVTASKRDEILQRKADWEAEYNTRKSRYEDQYMKFRTADKSESDRLSKAVKDAIGDTTLDLDIDVSSNFGGNGYKVNISDENDKFNESKALSWSYSARLDTDNNVVKETSSWSGLNATTVENLENLKEIVRVLEKLNNIDWQQLMSTIRPPKYTDYVTDRNPMYEDHPDFDAELREADLDNMVGTSIGIVCEDSKYYRGLVYRFITKINPSSYRVFDVPQYYADKGMTYDEILDKYSADSYVIQKAKMLRSIHEPEITKEF